MNVLPDYFPIEDAASWLSTKLDRTVSAEYLHELERSGAIIMEVRVSTEDPAGKSYWIHRDQMESLVPAVSAAFVKMINGRIDAFSQRRMDVYHAADIAAAEEQARLKVRESNQTQTQTQTQTEDDGLEEPRAETWDLKAPQRFTGYRRPLYELLKYAHAAGKIVPTSAYVIAAWEKNKPKEVVEVSSREIKYYSGGNSPTKIADAKAITKAIKRLIVKIGQEDK